MWQSLRKRGSQALAAAGPSRRRRAHGASYPRGDAEADANDLGVGAGVNANHIQQAAAAAAAGVASTVRVFVSAAHAGFGMARTGINAFLTQPPRTNYFERMQADASSDLSTTHDITNARAIGPITDETVIADLFTGRAVPLPDARGRITQSALQRAYARFEQEVPPRMPLREMDVDLVAFCELVVGAMGLDTLAPVLKVTEVRSQLGPLAAAYVRALNVLTDADQARAEAQAAAEALGVTQHAPPAAGAAALPPQQERARAAWADAEADAAKALDAHNAAFAAQAGATERTDELLTVVRAMLTPRLLAGVSAAATAISKAACSAAGRVFAQYARSAAHLYFVFCETPELKAAFASVVAHCMSEAQVIRNATMPTRDNAQHSSALRADAIETAAELLCRSVGCGCREREAQAIREALAAPSRAMRW